MPAPAHVRLSLSGPLGTPGSSTERWTITTSWTSNNGAGGAPFLVPSDLVAIRDGFMPAVGNRLSPAVGLDEVKAAPIGADGKYTGDAVLAPAAALQRGTGGTTHPFQTAVTVSLGTGQRGPSKRGRVFLPCPSVVVSAVDGTIDDAAATAFVTGMTTFLHTCATALSRTLVVASSKGYLTPVTTIRCGHVLDTQRRRRRGLKESYVQGAL